MVSCVRVYVYGMTYYSIACNAPARRRVRGVLQVVCGRSFSAAITINNKCLYRIMIK